MSIQEELKGCPSIDKLWLKYYSNELLSNEVLPQKSIYKYLYDNNKDNFESNALNFFVRKMTYEELFSEIDKVSKAFVGMGVKPGDVVAVCCSSYYRILCLIRSLLLCFK
jgi:long-chain acyl-CoA synthetase